MDTPKPLCELALVPGELVMLPTLNRVAMATLIGPALKPFDDICQAVKTSL